MQWIHRIHGTLAEQSVAAKALNTRLIGAWGANLLSLRANCAGARIKLIEHHYNLKQVTN